MKQFRLKKIKSRKNAFDPIPVKIKKIFGNFLFEV